MRDCQGSRRRSWRLHLPRSPTRMALTSCGLPRTPCHGQRSRPAAASCRSLPPSRPLASRTPPWRPRCRSLTLRSAANLPAPCCSSPSHASTSPPRSGSACNASPGTTFWVPHHHRCRQMLQNYQMLLPKNASGKDKAKIGFGLPEVLGCELVTVGALPPCSTAAEKTRHPHKDLILSDLKIHVWNIYGLLQWSDREYREAMKCIEMH